MKDISRKQEEGSGKKHCHSENRVRKKQRNEATPNNVLENKEKLNFS